jgi:hypothetical protein
MGDPPHTIVQLLREMRAENAAQHQQCINKLETIQQRLDSFELAQLADRRAFLNPRSDAICSSDAICR